MGKNWVGVNHILDDMDNDYLVGLYSTKRLMEEKPNFNKRKTYDDSKKVYERENFIILKVYSGNKVGYIVYNTKKDWKEGHTHLNSFDMAKTIISNVMKKKKPKTNNLYLIRSHIRISDDISYNEYIDNLISTKRNKSKKKYYNRSI